MNNKPHMYQGKKFTCPIMTAVVLDPANLNSLLQSFVMLVI